jgi:hypothetical protein
MGGFISQGSSNLREQPVATTATTSGNSGSLAGYGPAVALRAQLRVTAASGTTPTLDVVIEDTLDGGATWNTVGTFAQMTAAGRQVINVTNAFADNIRISWAVGGGTPSFTFAIDWVAITHTS